MRPPRTPRLLLAVCSGLTVVALATACNNDQDTAASDASSSQAETSKKPQDSSTSNPQAPEASSKAPEASAKSTPSQAGKSSPTLIDRVRDAIQQADEDNSLIDISLSSNATCTGSEMLTLTKLQADWQAGPYVELTGFSNAPGVIPLETLELHENPSGNPMEHWYFDCGDKRPGHYGVQFVSLDPVQVTESVTITVVASS